MIAVSRRRVWLVWLALALIAAATAVLIWAGSRGGPGGKAGGNLVVSLQAGEPSWVVKHLHLPAPKGGLYVADSRAARPRFSRVATPRDSDEIDFMVSSYGGKGEAYGLIATRSFGVSVAALDIASGVRRVIYQSPPDWLPFFLRVTPGGKMIVSLSKMPGAATGPWGSKLIEVDPGSGTAMELLDLPGWRSWYPSDTAFSPDGKSMLLPGSMEKDKTRHLMVFDLESKRLNEITLRSEQPVGNAVWIGGGKKIGVRIGSELRSVKPDGSDPHRLSLPRDHWFLSSSPDGRFAMVCDETNWWRAQKVHVLIVDTMSEPPKITAEWTGRWSRALWSPRSDQLAITEWALINSGKDATVVLSLADADGTHRRIVTPPSPPDFSSAMRQGIAWLDR